MENILITYNEYLEILQLIINENYFVYLDQWGGLKEVSYILIDNNKILQDSLNIEEIVSSQTFEVADTDIYFYVRIIKTPKGYIGKIGQYTYTYANHLYEEKKEKYKYLRFIGENL